MSASDLRRKRRVRRVHRGTQVIYGERKRLEEVMQSVERARLPALQKAGEIRILRKLIQARTAELNRINPSWDRKFALARGARTSARELVRLATGLPDEDYLLARVLTEHAGAPPKLLESLASHPYSAVRENVARHPHTPVEVLTRMARDRREPLWFLVASNPAAPTALRERLRERMQHSGELTAR